MNHTTIDGIDYGPLAGLLGHWIGERGLDIAPDANAEPDKNAYIDELTFTPSGPAENAEEQQLVSVRYHHLVRKKSNGKIFHDQIGHWIYEPATGKVWHSLTIPRGVVVLAEGRVKDTEQGLRFEVSATENAKSPQIVQTEFMLAKARTKAFKMMLELTENQLRYHETTSLHIYGKDFEHEDSSELKRVLYETD